MKRACGRILLMWNGQCAGVHWPASQHSPAEYDPNFQSLYAKWQIFPAWTSDTEIQKTRASRIDSKFKASPGWPLWRYWRAIIVEGRTFFWDLFECFQGNQSACACDEEWCDIGEQSSRSTSRKGTFHWSDEEQEKLATVINSESMRRYTSARKALQSSGPFPGHCSCLRNPCWLETVLILLLSPVGLVCMYACMHAISKDVKIKM